MAGRGLTVDWPAFYAGQQRRRVALPTYPFERKSYWLPGKRSARAAAAPQPAAATGPGLYASGWHQQALPAQDGGGHQGDWLVFLDEHGLGSYVVDRLQEQHQLVVTVTPAKAFNKISSNAYAIDPADPNGYALLLGAMLPARQPPLKILHLWTLAGSAFVQAPWLIPEWGYQSLLRIGEHLRQGDGEPPAVEILAVANQAVELFNEGNVPRKATLLGACETIAEAYPQVRCRLIDLETPSADPDGRRRLAQDLYREVVSGSGEMLVAWRNRRRWLPRWEPAPLPPAAAAAREITERLRPGAAYVVVGGTAGPAPAIVEHLLRVADGKVALVLPRDARPDAAGNRWLHETFGADASSGQRTGALRLGHQDSTALFRAELTDIGQMTDAIGQARELLGPVRGVVLAADGVLAHAGTLEKVEQVGALVERLVEAVLVVDSVLRGRPVDFMVFAGHSRPGSRGWERALERGAKAFLDAYARSRRAVHPDDLSICLHWQGWDEAELVAAGGPVADAFGRAVCRDAGVAELVEVKDDPDALRRQSGDRAAAPEVAFAASGHPRPELLTPFEEPRTELEKKIADVWQRVLGIREIGVKDNFFELGGDSLSGLRVMKLIQRELSADTSAIVLFENPTVEAICRVLEPPAEEEESMFDRAREHGARRRATRRARRHEQPDAED